MNSYRKQDSTITNSLRTAAALLLFSVAALGQTAKQPVQESTALTISTRDYAAEKAISFSASGRSSTVPSGKRLVIEHVSARASLPGSRSAAANQKLVVSILATLGGEQTEHFFVLTETAVLPFHPNDPRDKRFSYVIYQLSQSTKIYADPGTQVIIRALLDSAAVEGKSHDKNEALRLTVSGYLE